MRTFFKYLKKILLFLLAIFLCILVPIGMYRGYESIRASFLSPQEKRMEDLERLEYVFQNEFAGYQVLPGKETFEKNLTILKNKIAGGQDIPDETFNLEIIKLVAAFKDPHTNVADKSNLLPTRFPYTLTWNDGNFHITAGQVPKEWLGAKVLKFSNTPAEEVFHKLRAYTNAPNEAGSAYFMLPIVRSAEALLREGIISDRNKLSLLLVRDGDSLRLDLKALNTASLTELPGYNSMKDLTPDAEVPLYLKNSEMNYWYQWLEDEKLLYVRYSQCIDQGHITNFWNEVLEKIADLHPEKMVVDVRSNPGGDTKNHTYFLSRLQKDTLVNQYGKLFTLIDRGTGSAAVDFAADMERLTESVLVGEKTMDAPNTTSDPTYFTLPHSEITTVIPSLYSLHTHIHDKRDAVIPQIAIAQDLSATTYFTDRVLDSVKKMKLTNPEHNVHTGLPGHFAGQYTFSPLRNLELQQKDSTWTLIIDGLIEAPLLRKDSVFYTRKYNITLTPLDTLGQKLRFQLHNSTLELERIQGDVQSLENAISSNNLSQSRAILDELNDQEALPYYLSRPYFQAKIYQALDEHGFPEAYGLNTLVKLYYPDDPVLSIVDYELYQYDQKPFRQFTTLFPVIGKLLTRYYSVITTEKVMNDQYNAFIGR
ncbi:S41 family peptidase [Robertkochia flava]|uniref:hypothetical protein n=1 Tax=Robertkochia flava TaxID=3447986 RepID=UPI001CC957C9|nr:hypothetical protein [Robertkochia marina]